MPDIRCGRCEAVIVLPYRRDPDMPPLSRTCPICNKQFVMEDIDPTVAGKPGALEILQERMAREADTKPAVLVSDAKIPKKDWAVSNNHSLVRLAKPVPDVQSQYPPGVRTGWKPAEIQTF